MKCKVLQFDIIVTSPMNTVILINVGLSLFALLQPLNNNLYINHRPDGNFNEQIKGASAVYQSVKGPVEWKRTQILIGC